MSSAWGEMATAGVPGAGLNPAQQRAVDFGDEPLLIIAGAGSGKTQTLAHRVASLVRRGADPRRILLLTFTRRAATEMVRRVAHLLPAAGGPRAPETLAWAGTFHAVANRLLRHHAEALGLDPAFTLLDREDSADLLDRLRQQLALAEGRRRFPRKGTCLAIYSMVMNTRAPLRACLERAFPFFLEWEESLRRLFGAYTDAKLARQVLDYDDLLVYWLHLLVEAPASLERLFDHVLVDEYQDTNAIQAEILRRLRPSGRGVTVVGDDAQAIYSFRGATVRNILDFPTQYAPAAAVLTLEQNYRSTPPILDASNAVIGLARERFTKDLFSARGAGAQPGLVTVADEDAQVTWVADRILEQREAGVPLKQQAVLFRSSHHSDALELELGRRNIPYVKFGGLRFLESAHVKDALACLRWAENPRDTLAIFRTLQLLPGVGPKVAERFAEKLAETSSTPRHTSLLQPSALASLQPPPAARADWPRLIALVTRLHDRLTPWVGQLGLVRRWYEPYLEARYDNARTRLGDLLELERLADASASRERFLSDLTLDPPDLTGMEAGPPHLDEDYLILSTIHSAKGQEWDTVFVLNVADGCLPSDLATGTTEEIEEERRLLYVAMTRAKNTLELIHPLRFFVRQQSRTGDRHVLTPRSRFLPDSLLARFACSAPVPPSLATPESVTPPFRVDVAAKLRSLWN
jgi:DNA helicase-2/ATP-dependent DNA helicase PcrA